MIDRPASLYLIQTHPSQYPARVGHREQGPDPGRVPAHAVVIQAGGRIVPQALEQVDIVSAGADRPKCRSGPSACRRDRRRTAPPRPLRPVQP